MKKLKVILFVAVALLGFSIPARAQFQWGLQAGIVANDLKFDNKMFDASNRVGFVGGVTAQFNLPFGLGFQASLDYIHRVSEIKSESAVTNQVTKSTYKGDYLALPIHVKYNFSLPVVGHYLKPYIFTGPSFSYLVSKRKGLSYGVSKGDIEWDFGIGADIISHLQLNIGYGVGCFKVMDFDGKVRTNSWTITLGYLF